MKVEDITIVGVDPGYERLGIAILKKQKGKKEELIHSGCIGASPEFSFSNRLLIVGEEFVRLIKRFKPTALSIEKLFLTKNQKTAMMVAEVRGVILYEAARRGLSVFEYTPQQVKSAITGHGGSDKRQVASMVNRLLSIKQEVGGDDEYDAIALALTCIAIERKLFL